MKLYGADNPLNAWSPISSNEECHTVPYCRGLCDNHNVRRFGIFPGTALSPARTVCQMSTDRYIQASSTVSDVHIFSNNLKSVFCGTYHKKQHIPWPHSTMHVLHIVNIKCKLNAKQLLQCYSQHAPHK